MVYTIYIYCFKVHFKSLSSLPEVIFATTSSRLPCMFSQRYARTTAEGRRLWQALTKLQQTLNVMIGGIDDRVLHTCPDWPDLGPVLQAAKEVCEILDITAMSSMPSMEWTTQEGGYERAKWFRHTARVLSQQLDDIGDQNYCMSVRFLEDPFCPHYDKIESNIGYVGDSLVTFYAPAYSIHRSVTPM